jgi:Ca-activated chloride channel family protein
LSPADTDFGVTVLDKSSDKRVTIQNTGNGNLRIGQIAQQDPLVIPFSIVTDECSGAIVSPSSSCDLVIRFSPTSQVDYSDSFDIPSNDSDEAVLTATLRGKGRSLNVTIGRVGTIDPLLQTVMLIVSVTDRNDAPVISLLDNNFSLFENGSPRGISSFSNVINAPVSVGLVLDYSSSMIPFTPDLEAAAKSFIDLLDPVNDEAEVIKFATLIEVMQTFTNDQIALKNGIDALFPGVRVGTRLLDAMWDSIESTSSRSNERRAIIAVSDGFDDDSARTINEVIQNALGKNVSIYTIGIGVVDTVSMQQVAAETGGQYFFAPSSTDLASIYAKISEILSNQYTIEFQPSSLSGSTITIDVVVDNNGELGEYSRNAII